MPTISALEAKRLKIPKTSLKTIIFDNQHWTVPMAKKWLKDHDYKFNTYRKTINTIRFKQNPDIKYGIFWSKRLNNNIILTFQQYE